MTLYIEPGRPINLGPLVPLGEGGQGVVLGLPDEPEVCFKFFLEPSEDLDRRVNGLLKQRPTEWPDGGEQVIAWPKWPLRDETGRIRSVVLPRFDGASLYALFDADQRLEFLDRPTWATCLQAAIRISSIYRQLHRVDVVVGDVSPNNLIVDRSGRIALIDCDSVQFVDDWSREVFPADVATREYCSPEALRSPIRHLAPSHDLFGMAILLCQLLMDGDHPFEGRPLRGPDRGVEGNIREGTSALFTPERLVPVAGRLDLRVLPTVVQQLAFRALSQGHTQPHVRPSAAEWERVLRGVLNDLLGCPRHANHFFPAALGRCPWCARYDAGIADHFPLSSRRPR
ncbi:hypothetical protein ACFY36_10190 [Actinoplanes sp. NPDC000266]